MAHLEPQNPDPGILVRAARELFGAPDSGELLRRFFALVREAVPCDGLEAALLLPTRRAVRLVAVGPEGLLPSPGAALPLQGTSYAHAMASGIPYISGDLQAGELRYPDEELCRSRGIRRVAMVPLGAPGQWLGALRAGRGGNSPFTEEEVARFGQLCEPFAQALSDVEARAELRAAVARERALVDIAAEALPAPDLGLAFQAVCDALARVMVYDRLVLFGLDGERVRALFFRDNVPEIESGPLEYEWAGSHLEGAIRRREPYLYRFGESHFPQFEALARLGFRCALGAPVLAGGAVFGTLSAGCSDPDAYGADDLDLVQRAARLLGQAVERFREHEHAQLAATRERNLRELRASLSGQLDVQEVFDTLVSGLRRICPFEFATSFDLRDEWYVPLATDAPPEARDAIFVRHRLEDTLVAESLRAGNGVRRQGGQGGDSDHVWSLANGYVASLVLPVILRGQLVGKLALVSRDPDAFPPGDMDFLRQAARQFGAALEGARAFAEVQRLAQRERDLLEITNTLASFHHPRDVYPAMMEALQRLVDFDRSVVFSIEGEWMRPINPAQSEDDPGGLALVQRWRESDARVAIETRRPARYVLEEQDSERSHALRAAGLRTLAYVPVPGRDQAVAVFALASQSPDALTPGDLRLVGRAAQQFGLALENARAHSENLRLAERERNLLELANALTVYRDPQEILQEVLPAVRRLVRFEPSDAAIMVELDGETMRPVATSAPAVRESRLWRPFRWADLPVAQVLATGQPRRLPVERLWPAAAESLGALGFRVSALVPMVIHGRTVGVLWLVSPRQEAFPAADVDVFARIAQQLGLTLEAGRGYIEIQRREEKLELENRYLKEELSEVAGFEEIIGVGPALARVRELVRKVARTGTVVLIRGESGTGKELVAEAVHRLSARADRPLIKVNCAALPESLIGSELFGHEKGAFTGAFAQRLGRFELARGGTIFLDEIAELSPDVQSNLLRVLQEGEFERVGSSTTQKTDARVITATNRDLEVAVADGRFRQDLFYRLNVFPIYVPPLRERPEDIPVLAYYFLHRLARRMGRNITRLAPESEARMIAYSWPGNIRELQNVIERAVILCDGDELRLDPSLLSPGQPEEPARPARPFLPAAVAGSLVEAERTHILAALRRAGGRIAGPGGAAEILALKRTTLNSKIKKLGISRHEFLQ
ncbi:MAG: sigma 54-interacting transcriptional regulator [Candidatus Eisenbacteria bacterium]|nr:sigma 54-interacting transcriptional regulator [Candidatus Eisenbacteria bacterium]